MKKSKVVICIYGGNLQRVYTNIKNLSVEVFDFDNMRELEKSEIEKYESDYNKAIQNLQLANYE